ncbi:MAG TPA: hypothetical protein VEK79_19460 [Thermoanaerobaculia bacterium]|nr:hypothetical protein [Thermoanaerobaculia bacterium]
MKYGACILSAVLLLQTGCSDNAIKLRFGIEAAADRLAAGSGFSEERVSYVPVAAPAKGYWLIFFPHRRVNAEELISRGMPRDAADRIFRDLGYIDVGHGPLLVVFQDGERLNFTRYDGTDRVVVRDLIVEYRVGKCEVLVRKQGETLSIEKVL